MIDQRTGAIVLAAGRGTRMGSQLPKVLHLLHGRPMIEHVASVLGELGFGVLAPKPVYVVGFGSNEVERVVGDRGIFAVQRGLLGTGDAASVGLDSLPGECRRVLLIHGDEPMIEPGTYREMLDLQSATGAGIVLLTGVVSDVHALGRVVRDDSGRIRALVQEKELSPDQYSIMEINFGAYVFDRSFMEQSLRQLEKHAGGEYYLTDLVRFAAEAGRVVESVSVPFPDQQMGINDAEQLARAEAFLKDRERGQVPSQTAR